MIEKLPILMVAVGGALGSVSRYLVGYGIAKFYSGPFPVATFLVNITGSFALGFLGAWLATKGEFGTAFARYAVGMGFVSAYTTFSTFELETLRLLEGGRWPLAVAYVAGSVVVGLIAVKFGIDLYEGMNRTG